MWLYSSREIGMAIALDVHIGRSRFSRLVRQEKPMRACARRPWATNMNVKRAAPHFCNFTAAIVLIGKNSRGNWVVREEGGSFGGLFASRAHAYKYALFENGYRQGKIIEVSGKIELDILPERVAGTRVNVD